MHRITSVHDSIIPLSVHSACL